ncbi:MAG: DUF1934 domain-containing protein [Erysipelotrichaceae bacterium]|nr:DUF1934 domain-containing protein [Erysipelotrichaceae bacterium]
MQIKVHYKAIFVTDNDKDTIEYKEIGKLEKNNLSFNNINIYYDDYKIILKNGSSSLLFHYYKDTYNQYDVGYGKVNMTTRLLKFTKNDHTIKMKYQLLDHGDIITTVYILVEMIPYEGA